MARSKAIVGGTEHFTIHDENQKCNEQKDYDSTVSEETDDEVEDSVLEDIRRFNETFTDLSKHYRLLNRIGEGTFSTVYKAEDLRYHEYDNEWDIEHKESNKWASPPIKKRRTGDYLSPSFKEDGRHRRKKGPQYVAIKKIYVTSSPMRIQNELELLHDLRGCDSVCPLITAFRHQDQVVAVLPYFRHVDFREYFRDMNVADMRLYFRSLFTALAAVHRHDILHRDIKPTQVNFLYDIERRRGVLVDFGLAEREGTDSSHCICQESASDRRERLREYPVMRMDEAEGYPKNDLRPSKRANRAGTRGFRAPEVLFKCTDQTTKIDIWSAGVILLTILSRRFPFFNSTDDVEALVEIATIFGKQKMKACALLHGAVFQTNIPTIGDRGYSFEKLILWSTNRSNRATEESEYVLTAEESRAIVFLTELLRLDPSKRISAEQALAHEFLACAGEGEADEDEMELI